MLRYIIESSRFAVNNAHFIIPMLHSGGQLKFEKRLPWDQIDYGTYI